MVAVENKILLVPLSNMMLRWTFRTEVVLPFTDKRGEASRQVEEVPAGKEAKIGLPARHGSALLLAASLN